MWCGLWRKNVKNKKMKISERPVALVTGGASPLGSAICRQLADQDMNIAVHYGKSKMKSLALKEELRSKGVEVLLASANLSKPAQAQKLARKVAAHFGRIDLLVNSASVFEPTPLAGADWAQWEKIINVNSLAPAALAVAALPWLQKRRGVVINITDIYGEMPILKDHAAYSASKAALIFLTRYLALALGDQVRVNAVSPGVITLPGHYTSAQQKSLIQKSALKRQGKPEEIAQAVWFLYSNQFVTGQVLRVDGGRFIS